MRLDDCPLCSSLVDAKIEEGRLCAKVQYHRKEYLAGVELTVSVTAVVLSDHEGVPSPEAFVEAMDLLGSPTGLVEEIRDVAGHWGAYVKAGNWAATARSEVHDTER